MKPTLEQLRQDIDQLDDQILQLLNRRAALAIEIGAIKQANGAALYVPSRERDVLNRLMARNEGPLSHRSICRIYSEIMTSSLALEHKVSVLAAGASDADLSFAVRFVAGSHATLRVQSDPAQLTEVFAANPDALLVLADAWIAAHPERLPGLKADWKGCWRFPSNGTDTRFHLFAHPTANSLSVRPATVYGLVESESVAGGVPPAWVKQVPASSVEFAMSASETSLGILQWKMELSARDTRDQWASFFSQHCRAVWIVS